MKGLIIVAAVASVLSSPSWALVKKPTKAKNEKSAPAAEQVVAMAPQSATAIPAVQAGTSTVKAEEVKKDLVDRKIKGDFATQSVVSHTSVADDKGSVGSDLVMGVSYSLGEGKSIGVRQLFKHKMPLPGEVDPTKNAASLNLEDTYLHGSIGKIASFAGDGALSIKGRLYLPTGESSRMTHKRQGAVRMYLIADKPMGKVDLSYVFMPQYNNHTQDRLDGDALMNASLVQYIDVAYNFSDKLTLSQSVGTTSQWAYNIGQKAEEFNLATTLRFAPIPQFAISTSLWNDINIYDSKEAFSLGRPKEVSYVLSLEASI